MVAAAVENITPRKIDWVSVLQLANHPMWAAVAKTKAPNPRTASPTSCHARADDSLAESGVTDRSD